jgi:hypothetical protein
MSAGGGGLDNANAIGRDKLTTLRRGRRLIVQNNALVWDKLSRKIEVANISGKNSKAHSRMIANAISEEIVDLA